MSDIKVHLKILDSGLEELSYADEGCSGFDLRASIQEDVIMAPHERALIPCGFKMELPLGYEAQVRPRSGLALNYGITVLNTPGTIDSSYRGEVKVILMNLGQEAFTIQRNMRIAQCVIAPVTKAHFVHVETLSDSVRQEKGFGSSGL
jgi:dUTP pyrophosphatase